MQKIIIKLSIMLLVVSVVIGSLTWIARGETHRMPGDICALAGVIEYEELGLCVQFICFGYDLDKEVAYREAKAKYLEASRKGYVCSHPAYTGAPSYNFWPFEAIPESDLNRLCVWRETQWECSLSFFCPFKR